MLCDCRWLPLPVAILAWLGLHRGGFSLQYWEMHSEGVEATCYNMQMAGIDAYFRCECGKGKLNKMVAYVVT